MPVPPGAAEVSRPTVVEALVVRQQRGDGVSQHRGREQRLAQVHLSARAWEQQVDLLHVVSRYWADR